MKNKLSRILISFVLVSALVIPPIQIAYAHSGRTDASGCHQVKKTGQRHCHTPKVKSAKKSAKKYSKTASKRSR